MSVYLIKKEEAALLNLILTLGPVAWYRYQNRYSDKWVTDSGALSMNTPSGGDCHFERDCSGRPPYISFRFEPEDERLIEKIREVVTNYRGDVKWIMAEHKRISLPGTNRSILPEEAETLKAQILSTDTTNIWNYIASHKPELGPKAYNDLRGLAKYASQCFGIPLIQEIRSEDTLAFDLYKCYDDPESFFSLLGSELMTMTRRAALEACRVAAAKGKIVWGIECGVWRSTGFERNGYRWSAPDTPMDKEQAHRNNLEGIKYIENRNESDTFILTTRNCVLP